VTAVRYALPTPPSAGCDSFLLGKQLATLRRHVQSHSSRPDSSFFRWSPTSSPLVAPPSLVVWYVVLHPFLLESGRLVYASPLSSAGPPLEGASSF